MMDPWQAPPKPPAYDYWSSPANELGRDIRGHRSSIKRGLKTTGKVVAYPAVAGLGAAAVVSAVVLGLFLVAGVGAIAIGLWTTALGHVVLIFYGLPTLVGYGILRTLKYRRDHR